MWRLITWQNFPGVYNYFDKLLEWFFFTTNFCCKYLIQQQLPGIDKCTCIFFGQQRIWFTDHNKKNGPEVEKLMKTGKFELSISYPV